MGFYRKKPVIIEAWRIGSMLPPGWLPEPIGEIDRESAETAKLSDGQVMTIKEGGYLIGTLESAHIANADDWIIRGTQGEIYPCKPAIFDEIYEPVV